MKITSRSSDLGKQDAQSFIGNERIDYEPFVALSDLHLVRKTVPVTFQGLQETVLACDPALWPDLQAAAHRCAEQVPEDFSYDEYAQGFVAGVAAVWEKIRDQVLSDPDCR